MGNAFDPDYSLQALPRSRFYASGFRSIAFPKQSRTLAFHFSYINMMKRRRSNLVQGLENLLSKAESELSEKKKLKLKAKVEHNARAMQNRDLKKQDQKLIKKTMLEQAQPMLMKKSRKLKESSPKIISSAFESNRRKH